MPTWYTGKSDHFFCFCSFSIFFYHSAGKTSISIPIILQEFAVLFSLIPPVNAIRLWNARDELSRECRRLIDDISTSFDLFFLNLTRLDFPKPKQLASSCARVTELSRFDLTNLFFQTQNANTWIKKKKEKRKRGKEKKKNQENSRDIFHSTRSFANLKDRFHTDIQSRLWGSAVCPWR